MTCILRIYRGVAGAQYWEEFELPCRPGLNVISALMEIQKNPVNRKGEKVTPVVWEQGCLEEVCGSCSMLINGKPRQACTALLAHLPPVVTLAPFTKYPLIRDLIVDRQSLFESLKKVKAWVEVDDATNVGPGPKISQEMQEAMYLLSTCMSCGCCSEACPQVNQASSFMGPAPISQVRLFNAHPVGKLVQHERLNVLAQAGGVSECGNAQNCAAVCPKKIPLTESIAVMGRKVTQHALHTLISLPDIE